MTEKMSFEEACRRYIYRYIMEHIPLWSRHMALNGMYYAPQYRTDREWYENTIFPGDTLAKFHDSRSNCESGNHSYPLGEWLDIPYDSSTTNLSTGN